MLNNIQYLRGVAILLVVIGHTLQLIAEKVYNADSALLHHFDHVGRAGVDMAFVLSGFIIFHTTRKLEVGTQAMLHFWLRRLCRIVPAYWLITTLILGLHLTGLPASKPDLSFGYLLRSYLLLPTWSGPDGMISPLLTTAWTLPFQMFFYLLFGGLLLLAAPLRGGAFAALVAVLLLLGWLSPSLRDTSASFHAYTSPLLLEFLYGIAIAHWYSKAEHTSVPVAWTLILTGSVVILVTLSGEEAPRSLVSGLPAGAIVMGAVMLERVRRHRASVHASLKLLGDMSYSLLLSHAVGLYALSFVARRLSLDSPLGATGFFAVAMLTLLAGAAVFYVLFEQPLTLRLQRRWLPASAKPQE